MFFKILIPSLVFTCFSLNIYAMRELEPTEEIEVAFVLIPSAPQQQAILSLSEDIATRAQKMPHESKGAEEDQKRGDYNDKPVGKPHMSNGHFKLHPSHLQALQEILSQISSEFSAFSEEMAREFTVDEDSVIIEVQNTKEKTNPLFEKLFRRFMKLAKDKIPNLSPIRQFEEKLETEEDPHERELLGAYFQNSGIPVEKRMAPHWTLLYNYKPNKQALKQALKDLPIPDTLNTVTLEAIGFFQLDYWRNPLPDGKTFVAPFKKED
jgi:hypothetical protein